MSHRRKKPTTKRPEASSPVVRRRMQATPQRDTPCELAVRRAVHRLGLRFFVDRPVGGTRRRADLLFPRQRVAVFVDGCFWHGCSSHGTWPKANAAWWRMKIRANVRRDRDVNVALAGTGWRVLRFWEHEEASLAAAKIAQIVRKGTSG